MQKTATLLLLFFSFIFSSIAQTTNCELVHGFTPTLTASNTYHFQNTSLGLSNTDSIRWTFGDGTASNQVSPNHSYAQPGHYNVCIRIQKRNSAGTLSNCVRELCHGVILGTSNNCEVVAGFTSTLTATNTFHFQNTTTGLSPNDSIRWTFGDGTASNQLNPAHTYTHPGNYNVCIRIQKRNPNGVLTNCVRELCHIVIVGTPTNCEMVAAFTSTLVNPNTFHFQNTSIGLSTTDSIRWTFGDGTSSNQMSPHHTYAQPGHYNVCIRIQKRNSAGALSACVRELCHIVTVEGQTNCAVVAGFTTTFLSPNTFHFQNTSTGLSGTDSIRWTFGDGTSSNQVSPNHTYAQPGQYNVCIRIQRRNSFGQLSTCVRELCHTITVGNPAGCEMTAAFIATPTAPNTFHFQNTSIGLSPHDSVRWTFGDGSSSNQVSPNHTYMQPGHYQVCIRIVKRNSAGTITNCVREFCHIVIVETPHTCEMVAGFTTSLIAPNSYHFQNTSTGLSLNDSIRWTFGDGTSSNQLHPNHTYAQPGHYNVCLRTQKRFTGGFLSSCVREVCHMVESTSNTSCALPYPNPASNNINVQVPLLHNQMIHVFIYNASNLLVKEKHQQGFVGGNLVTVLIGDLMPGVYSMKVIHENNVCTTSFVKL